MYSTGARVGRRRSALGQTDVIVDHSARIVRVVHVRRGARQRPTADELRDE